MTQTFDMTTAKNRIVVIPDVHGRDFWKKPVANTPCDRIIFLGDYVDPYFDEEGVDGQQALSGFYEVLDLKAKNPRKVVLLLGNHDLHYLSERFYELAGGDRFDKELSPVLSDLFHQHKKDFCMAHEELINGKRYLFTHAGVTSSWYKRHSKAIKELTAANLNHLLKTKRGINALAEIGELRGGDYLDGSMVWADSDEMRLSAPIPDVYQVFGHTQQWIAPIIKDHYACLDCRKAFLLDENEFSVL